MEQAGLLDKEDVKRELRESAEGVDLSEEELDDLELLEVNVQGVPIGVGITDGLSLNGEGEFGGGYDAPVTGTFL